MADPAKLHIDILRSPLGRARGLGAAKAGTHHWWASRVTSVALVPLSIWFLFCVLGLLGAGAIRPAIFARLPLREVRQAQELLDRGAALGRIVMNLE